MTRQAILAALREACPDREEAIRQLNNLGYDARARDWAMGNTIFIPGPLYDDSGGIGVWPVAVYLYPDQDGLRWHLMDGSIIAPVATFDCLCLAVRGVSIWIDGMTAQHLKRK